MAKCKVQSISDHECGSPPPVDSGPGGNKESSNDTDQRHVNFFSPNSKEGSDGDREVPSAIKVHRGPISPTSSNMTGPTYIMQSPTMETVDSSASRQSPKGEAHTVNIEHKVKAKRSGTAKKITKPLIALIGAVVLLTTSSAAYFFSEFLTIPGLKTQVDRLEEQVALLEFQVHKLESQVDRLGGEVDRLEYQVDRLGNETDRLSDLNEDLEQNIDNYVLQNDILNSSLVLYGKANVQLDETVAELQKEVHNLTDYVEVFAGLNADLNHTVSDLSYQVDRLDTINEELSQTNSDLWQAVDHLSNETAELSMLNGLLSFNVGELKDEVFSMSGEIDRLDNITANLATLVTFLNETTLTIDETFNVFTAYISDQITSYRVLVMDTSENLYRQRAAFWDCDFREYFLVEPFTTNRNAPVGVSAYPEVIEYIEDRVLSDLCLNTTDFELFLASEYVGSPQVWDASFNQLQQAVGLYTDLAVYYYFSSGLTAVSPDAWAEAHYRCDSLSQEARFRYGIEASI
mmetsp:Transcript_8516/g.14124  ORF Transcript_8516/g.14124 Transcript_8516/m.14124 type:complete len:517 (-) Transcript_8516:1052-2602(-)|eukprot:CAMPEP_0119021598 /NCGR_PEP_ID=MMETSP1176-20130426/26299_1 /TAXON_ID=265551 /ORGANISM="Synedropsis recta cf, Strain CCMP1620" /LENGTH=516 /DNA_ID=CAMNT_0006976235 /DNA_START=13 /DNA_END=1563 /DNA_ORIENTATION=+